MSQVNFIFCLHNHQPVGNFDNVFEEAYKLAYEPFFEVADKFPEIKLCLHYSGPLLEWLEHAHPKFISKLQKAVADNRIELLGGGFYEPILTMLPDEDKIGQITMLSDYLEKRFGKRPRGIWLAERVWEQSLTKTLADAGVEYTIVDDYHFKTTGFTEKQLDGYYLTEDQGKTMAIFPIPELLRYAIPFRSHLDTLGYLHSKINKTNSHHPVICYADDGEKFGIWPKTYEHCYRDKWLETFFVMLREQVRNKTLNIVTYSEALDTIKPRGKAYLPDCSYREMTEWSLPVDIALAYEDISKKVPACIPGNNDSFVIKPGGYWRNFQVKYQEIGFMYAKMLEISQQVNALRGTAKQDALIELYKGQGNCAYWHGVFGGFYLPHLRHAMYQHLIKAEKLMHKSLTTDHKSLITIEDYDRDGYDEVKLASPNINCYLKPSQGGTIYEYDIIPKSFNPLATLSRRREAYHLKILQAQNQNSVHNIATIHDLVVAKTPGLENLLYYDEYLRNSLIDHFFWPDTLQTDFAKGTHTPAGNFVNAPYQFKIHPVRSKSPEATAVPSRQACSEQSESGGTERTSNGAGKSSVTLWYDGEIKRHEKSWPLRLEKTVSFSDKNGLILEIEYSITNPESRIPEPLTVIFAPEFNLSMLAGNAHDRYYYADNQPNIGPLITIGEAKQKTLFGIKDEYQKIDISLGLSKPADIWHFPVQTVSQSEGGFELIYQSSVILPRWEITLEPSKPWQVKITKKVALL